MAPLLQADELSKRFAGVPVLREFSFAVDTGEVLGIVGENGAGKSTLMNLLAGVLPPTSGRMFLAGQPFAPGGPAEAERRGVAMVHQELNLFPNLTIAENLFLTAFPVRRLAGVRWLDRKAARAAAGALLRELDLALDPDSPVERLSAGERQLVEIAKALQRDARVVIFDEPTTSLTSPESERLHGAIRRLAASGKAVLYVSHALGAVLNICDRVLVLRDGVMAGAAHARELTESRLIALMAGGETPASDPSPVQERSCVPVVEARGLSHPSILEDVSFTLHRNEILGVAGLMGSGRSELARVLFGLDPCDRGHILLEGREIGRLGPRERIRLGMAFVTESRRDDGLLMSASSADNLALVWPRVAQPARLAALVRLRCASLERQPVIELSGGNQQKVALGKWLASPPKAMILDEPTRGIDVAARKEIHAILRRLAAAGAGLLVISSEIEELIELCDRILVMRRGSIAGSFEASESSREAILEQAL